MLQEGRGSIVNIASGASSVRGMPNRYVYGATKAAVIGLTKAVAADFIRKASAATPICPGTIESPSLDERIATHAKSTGQSEATGAAGLHRPPADGPARHRRGGRQCSPCFSPPTNRAISPARSIWSTAASRFSCRQFWRRPLADCAESSRMHVLITGAAGMIGRKLTERLVEDGALNGKPIDTADADRHRRAGRSRPAFPARSILATADLAGAGHRREADRRAAGRDLPSRRRRLGRGRDRFREGLSRQSRRHAQHLLEAIRKTGDGYKPKVVFTSSIAVFGAPFPPAHPRRLPSDAADLLRHAEGDGRIAARRLHPARLPRRRRHPPADHLRAARQAEQGGVRLLLRHHPRAARRQEAMLPVAENVRHTHASPALGGRLPRPRAPG